MPRAVRRMLAATLGVGLAIATLTPAGAQEATFRAGGQPDPLMVNVAAGGPVDVGAQLPGCEGRISDTSSFVVNYEGSGKLPLSFYAWASPDTTLVVFGADRVFYCDDDGLGAVFGTLDPVVTIPNAPAGTYTIWVGTFSGEAEALLGITTGGPHDIAAALGIPATLVRTDRLVATPAVPRPAAL